MIDLKLENMKRKLPASKIETGSKYFSFLRTLEINVYTHSKHFVCSCELV